MSGRLVSCLPIALALAACTPDARATRALAAAAPAAERIAEETGLKTAILAGGCFWSVEAVFSHVEGVKTVISGYHGGTQRSARYDLVTSGITDHVEAVKITYDPSVIRYDQLLRIFFSTVADPTLTGQQGPDRGPEYTMRIIPVSVPQHAVASAYLAQLKAGDAWLAPLGTARRGAQPFYPAEAYHQDFAAKNPQHGYVQRWSKPKVSALERLFPGFYSASFRHG